MEPIKAGDIVKFKPEFCDEGDDEITWIAIEDEDKGRVTVQAQVGQPFSPTQVVLAAWLEESGCEGN